MFHRMGLCSIIGDDTVRLLLQRYSALTLHRIRIQFSLASFVNFLTIVNGLIEGKGVSIGFVGET